MKHLLQNRSSANYSESHRPQLHFSPPAMWMNDPNGLVYANGEYHLFYQYYPQDTVWGPMHWGHAVSRDLIHWENLPVALAPDAQGYIFSGSAVVDENNTAGFKIGKDAPLVAMFTYHDPVGEKNGRSDFQTQGIAYSTDRGRTWTKYKNNPVIPNSENLKDFRDPKVFWHEATRKWLVALAVGDHIIFDSSPDLKNWKRESEFGLTAGAHGGVWECPDLFPLKVEGTNQTKWVLLVSINPGAPLGGSGTQYFIGDFDGKTFKNDNSSESVLWLDEGRDNYAGVTWANAPDNRRLFLGWMSNWEYAQKVPTAPWRSAMTLPRELGLRKTADGIRLFQKPVREVEGLRANEIFRASKHLVKGELKISDKSPLVEMIFEIDLAATTAKSFGVKLENNAGEIFTVGYEPGPKRFYTDRTRAGKNEFSADFAKSLHFAARRNNDNLLKIHLIFDKSSVEMFADDGEITMTDIFFPTADFNRFSFLSEAGETKILDARAWNLKSIW